MTPANGQPAQLTLTISTLPASAQLRGSLPAAPRRSPWIPGGAMVSFAGVVGFLRKRAAYIRDRSCYRSWLRALCVGILFCGVSLCMTGCGGVGGQTPPMNPGTAAGTTMIAITASTSGSTSSQNASVQLTVQ